MSEKFWRLGSFTCGRGTSSTNSVESLVDPTVGQGVLEKRKNSYPGENRTAFPLSSNQQRGHYTEYHIQTPIKCTAATNVTLLINCCGPQKYTLQCLYVIPFWRRSREGKSLNYGAECSKVERS